MNFVDDPGVAFDPPDGKGKAAVDLPAHAESRRAPKRLAPPAGKPALPVVISYDQKRAEIEFA